MMELKEYPFKVGLFGIGLEAYWCQFPGLRERLEGYVEVVESKIAAYGAQVVNLGLVDTPDINSEGKMWM
jgi:L-arabinose isomerase